MKAESWTAWNMESKHVAFTDDIVNLYTVIGRFMVKEEDGDALMVQCNDGTLLVELVSANTFRIKINRRM